MRGISLAVAILLSICLLGCGHIKYNVEKEQGEYEMLDNVCNIIISSLRQNDITELYDILSPAAIKTDDIETGFEYSCQYFTEEISNVDLSAGYSGGTTEHGTNRASNFRCGSATVTTASGKSINVWFEYWFINDFSTDKIGVNRIKISYTDEIFKDNYIGGGRYERAGIYNPEWDNEYR